MSTLIVGFGVSLSLIVAIGAQNAFVLRQGLRREHVFIVALFCAVSDAILIWAGVLSLGLVSNAAPWVLDALRWGGALFLVVYGMISFRSAWRGGAALAIDGGAGAPVWTTMLTLAALTWLNPHVYLDTFGLIGSIAQGYGADRYIFGIGASIGSGVFFFGLGYGARFLAPVFANPKAWQLLDFGIGVVMWAIAVSLLIH